MSHLSHGHTDKVREGIYWSWMAAYAGMTILSVILGLDPGIQDSISAVRSTAFLFIKRSGKASPILDFRLRGNDKGNPSLHAPSRYPIRLAFCGLESVDCPPITGDSA